MIGLDRVLDKYPPASVASRIEHTLLRPDASIDALKKRCLQAIEFGFYGCCISPWFVKEAAQILSGTGIKVVTVAGFPLGFQPPVVKIYEIEQAAIRGANEVDVVMNISMFKSGDEEPVERELGALVDKSKEYGITLKVIIETSLLSSQEIARASKLVARSGADFVKTNTGFGQRGVRISDICIIRRAIGREVGIKAAGGIRHYIDAVALLEAGADRLGTSSGTDIIKEYYYLEELA